MSPSIIKGSLTILHTIIQISCSSASTELIDRSRFRRYFQLLQTMVDIADIYEGLINHYGWEYVSLVVQNENLYTVVSVGGGVS